MKINELLELLEYIGPLSISEEFCKKFGAYDNSGIILDSGEEITGVLFSLDFSAKAVSEAEARGFNAIVTHHPAIFSGVKRISASDPDTAPLFMCLQKGISVISMHLNFDAAPEGIDYYMMRGLGGQAADTHLKLSGGAYGRVYEIKKRKFSNYIKYISGNFGTDKIIFYGDPEREVRKVASFCGAGCDDDAIAFATAHEADVFVSSEIKHNRLAALLARGMCVVVLTHYSAENYGFNRIYNKIIEELNVPAAYFCDGAMM